MSDLGWDDYYRNTKVQYANKILEIDRDDFIAWCYGERTELVREFMCGTVFIVKKFYSAPEGRQILRMCDIINREGVSGFYPMIDRVPDHSRTISIDDAKYSFLSSRKSYFFFRWNASGDAEKSEIWESIDRLWVIVKLISGHSADAYIGNVPSIGPVDRGQIIVYEGASGEMESHVDPHHTQRIIAGVEFTKRGIHYAGGGFFAHSERNKILDVQAICDPGDAVLCAANIPHGVARIVPLESAYSSRGENTSRRIYLGLYTNDPDGGSARRTSVAFRNLEPESIN